MGFNMELAFLTVATITYNCRYSSLLTSLETAHVHTNILLKCFLNECLHMKLAFIYTGRQKGRSDRPSLMAH